jgi:hypothetical protein
MHKVIDFADMPVEFKDRLAASIKDFVQSLTADDLAKIAPNATLITFRLNMELQAAAPGTQFPD